VIFSESSALGIFSVNNFQIGCGDEWTPNFNINNELKIGDGSIVEVDVDMEKKEIHYTVNNILCPYYHHNVSSSPLLFGFRSSNSTSIIEVISVQYLIRSRIDPSAKCEEINMLKNENGSVPSFIY
jgi:hypothetical protein